MQLKPVLFFLGCLFSANLWSQNSFADQQMAFERVREAKLKFDKKVRKMFKDSGLSETPKYIYWRSFKLEDELELWASDSSTNKYKKIKTYKVCKGSGDLGPKRKMGDLQVPEGLYYVERYNPMSNYHLSMKISYPNESDLVFADKENPGNEIYMHGDCVSVGCLPMTDSIIGEIYWITVLSQSYQSKSSKIPIDIFPCRFNAKNWTYLKTNYSHKPKLIEFWKNLEEAYNFFEEYRIAPGFWVDQKGKYNIVFPQNYHIEDPNH